MNGILYKHYALEGHSQTHIRCKLQHFFDNSFLLSNGKQIFCTKLITSYRLVSSPQHKQSNKTVHLIDIKFKLFFI